MGFSFRNVNEFTPNLGQWSQVGDISSWARTGDAIRLNMSVPGLGLLVSFLGPRCFRVRFRPVVDADYTAETSPAVVERDLGPFRLTVQDGGDHVTADTGDMTVRIDLKPYRIQVFRGRQLLSADVPTTTLSTSLPRRPSPISRSSRRTRGTVGSAPRRARNCSRTRPR